jgi:tetratricopeptide (TPR) repeat protein
LPRRYDVAVRGPAVWLVSFLCFAPGALFAGDRQRAAERFLVARELAEEGRIDDALAALDEAAALTPGDAYLALERAQLLARVGRLDAASAAIGVARELAPGEPEVLRQQGRIEMGRLGDDPRAQETAKRAFEALRRVEPHDLEMLVSLGQLYLGSGETALAAEVLEEAHRQRPDHPWIQSLRTRALVASGESAAAERLQLDALRRDPGDLRARFELAERLARGGEHRRAAELLAAAPEPQRTEPELRFRLARQLFLAGDMEPARELAVGLVRERPEAAPSRYLLARTEIALGYFAAAEETLRPALPGADSDPLLTELLLRALEGQGRAGDAAQLLQSRRESLVRTDDLDGVELADLELARLWALGERWDLAAEAASRVLASREPERAEAALRTAARALVADDRVNEALELAAVHGGEAAERLRLELLLVAGRTDAALALAERLSAGSGGADLRIAALLQDAGAHAAALPVLRAARRAVPDSLEAGFRLASCLERLGRHDDAVAEFRDLLERAPSFAPALNYLGYLWIERAENLEQALRMVREAVRLDPDNGAYVDSLGWGFFQLGRLDEAVRTLERAARLLPSDPTVLEHLGDARAATGDVSGAREAYERAVAAGGDGGEELERKRRRLGGDS